MKQSDKVASFAFKRFIHSFIGFHIERTDRHMEKKIHPPLKQQPYYL